MKRIIDISIMIFLLFFMISCYDGLNDINDEIVYYKIGDIGPSGVGIVFYVTDGGLHGLEVAPENQTSSYWIQGGATQNTVNGNTSTAIGTGWANTAAIIAQTDHANSAALICRNYTGGGMTDWFLPSRDELNAIWVNLVHDGAGGNNGVGGFANYRYWSSSEVSGSLVWGLGFWNGIMYDDNTKNNSFVYTRAVRAF